MVQGQWGGGAFFVHIFQELLFVSFVFLLFFVFVLFFYLLLLRAVWSFISWLGINYVCPFSSYAPPSTNLTTSMNIFKNICLVAN